MLSMRALGMPIENTPHAVYSWLTEEPAGFHGLKTVAERGGWMNGPSNRGLGMPMIGEEATHIHLEFPFVASHNIQRGVISPYGMGAMRMPLRGPSQDPATWVRGFGETYAEASAGLTDTSTPGIWDTAPVVSSPTIGQDIVAGIQAIAPIGAVIAKNVTTPIATVAGPYGYSSIPITSTAQANQMLAGAGAGFSSLLSSPLLLGGIVLLVMMSAMGHR